MQTEAGQHHYQLRTIQVIAKAAVHSLRLNCQEWMAAFNALYGAITRMAGGSSLRGFFCLKLR